MNLPHHRRYNWRIMSRNYRRAIWLTVAALLTLLAVLTGVEYASLHDDAVDYRLRLMQLQHDVMSVRTFGQVTATDFDEKTNNITVRSIK